MVRKKIRKVKKKTLEEKLIEEITKSGAVKPIKLKKIKFESKEIREIRRLIKKLRRLRWI